MWRASPGHGHLQYQHWRIWYRLILSAHWPDSLDTIQNFIVSEKSFLKKLQVGKLLRKPYQYQPMTYIGNYVSKWSYKYMCTCVRAHTSTNKHKHIHTQWKEKSMSWPWSLTMKWIGLRVRSTWKTKYLYGVKMYPILYIGTKTNPDNKNIKMLSLGIYCFKT